LPIHKALIFIKREPDFAKATNSVTSNENLIPCKILSVVKASKVRQSIKLIVT